MPDKDQPLTPAQIEAKVMLCRHEMQANGFPERWKTMEFAIALAEARLLGALPYGSYPYANSPNTSLQQAWAPDRWEVQACCPKFDPHNKKQTQKGELLRHCQSLEHVATLCDVPIEDLRTNIFKKKEPSS